MSGRAELTEKLAVCVWVSLAIELILFKFAPDLAAAFVQGADVASLTSFEIYEANLLTPGSVHNARFLGNHILYELAQLIAQFWHPADVRLHPLRIAAALLSPIYFFIGALPALLPGSPYSGRAYLALYGFAALVSLYVVAPCDLPSFACLSLGLYFLLEERLGPALLLMLITGLFRESAFHLVCFVAVWALCSQRMTLRSRIAWVGIFAVAFVVEYHLVRQFFPGKLTASGGVTLDVRQILFGDGALSLTSLMSVPFAAMFLVAAWIASRGRPRDDWRRRFFIVNALVFPGWLVFYRMMGGNLTEFRMLLPVILPGIFWYAYESGPGARSLTPPPGPLPGPGDTSPAR